MKRIGHRVAGTPGPENERLPLGKSYVYGLQHILTMYGGVIAPPPDRRRRRRSDRRRDRAARVGGIVRQRRGHTAADPRRPLSRGGKTSPGAGHFLRLGVHHGGGGQRSGRTAISVRSHHGRRRDRPVDQPFFCRIVRYFPPVVTGSIITVIGISLLPVAVRWAMGGNAKAPDWGSMSNIGLAGFSLFVVLLVSRLVQGTCRGCPS